ncbi:MAG: hypothetical protein O7H41_15805 [Planctomycetota bacterium]|nr:hypothetical protein [Planctomycetota bacterium]
MTPALSTSEAALLEATEDPRLYIERFLDIRHMETDALPYPGPQAGPHQRAFHRPESTFVA